MLKSNCNFSVINAKIHCVLACLTVLIAGFEISFNKVKAAPVNREQYCFQQTAMPNDGFLQSKDDLIISPQINYRINLRERPGISFKVQHVVAGRSEVKVFKRVKNDDGYCWFQVQLKKSNIKGWVRGDFLNMSDRD
ncbi:SH3 domain-containing protein [Aetokthonos hydrillicola Thurmond2011]|jgi:uncharacterized protein YgiM (DUF1202 family)|uniref:SH3 domain-containing protein n=1 Tax=Aetokthonos hydrillicola Thurmond2011 TaxID=2712845 RepID=A0AAP5IE22_9CYAN|nr:SH3 domain-containing protein [Aetokthonos hydrillicola]MBO3457145.1 SH3 domain-containing protein [Aetokthonos hydrillicola CCALA 1050]MBW4587491.1 SH3 domain-containing protein [Aetokthonos hydrillicola CCALA 1050]MDR9898644.1 SH3 domain-containing protein [Aetokthonos hydrillicola Thurmond2011]